MLRHLVQFAMLALLAAPLTQASPQGTTGPKNASPGSKDASPPSWTEGRNYFRIVPDRQAQVPSGKIEVTEVFSYACPFCAQFDPLVQQFKRTLPPNAELVYLPASFNPGEDWPMFQRATCTAQTLGILDKTHAAMFDAVWKTGELAIVDPQTRRLKSPLPSIEEAARFYNRLSGVPIAKFLDASKGFSVETKMRVDDGLVMSYQVDSTPTLVIDRKYRITVQSAGGMPQMLEVARWLIAQESRQGAARSTPPAKSDQAGKPP